MAREKTNSKKRIKNDFLTSKKLWAPVLLLILLMFVYFSLMPVGKFSFITADEQSSKAPTVAIPYNSPERLISKNSKNLEIGNIRKILELERKRIEFLQPTHSRNGYYRFESLPNGEDCIQLNQSFFDEHVNEDILFDYEEGCVELTEDIFFNNTIIVSGGSGGFYFTCRNHTVTGHPYFTNPAFLLNESATVIDCKLEWPNTGFALFDNSAVIDSSVRYGYVGEAFNMFDFSRVERSAAINHSTGFLMRDFSVVTDSIADGNLYFGFVMFGNSSVHRSSSRGSMVNFDAGGGAAVYDSSAEGGMEGFSLQDSASALNITATGAGIAGIDLNHFARVSDAVVQENGNGFMATWPADNGVATITRGTARNNDVGFELASGVAVSDSVAEQNDIGFRISETPQLDDITVRDNEYGFVLYGSTINGLTALNNTYGFSLSDTRTSGLTALNSSGTGFYLYGSSSLEASIARGGGYGFRLFGSSTVTNSRAEQNEYGFQLYSSSIVTGSTASDNRHHGFELLDTSSVSDVTSLRNGNAEDDYGILLKDVTTATNIVSDYNKNGVFVEGCGYEPSRLLEGRRVCNNNGYDIFVSGGYVEGTFQTSHITGSNCWNGNWSGMEILPCSVPGGKQLPYEQFGEGI